MKIYTQEGLKWLDINYLEFPDRNGLTSYSQDRSEKYLPERRRPFSELHPPLERGRSFSEPQNSEEYSPFMNENEEKG